MCPAYCYLMGTLHYTSLHFKCTNDCQNIYVVENCKSEWLNIPTCVNEYTIPGEDDGSYCVGWENGPCVRGQSVYNITHAAWNFVSSLDIWGLPTTGIHNIYGGGGYIAEFIVNYNISKQIIDDLYTYIWIDRKTRAVFTEFTLYNVNNNVFIYVSLLCEFVETGGILTSSSIKPLRPYQHVDSLGIVTFICEIIVLVGIIVFAVRKAISFHKRKIKTVEDIWDVLDILIILMFFICTIMYIGRWIMIDYSMTKFAENKNKFVNFSHIATWDDIFNIFLSIIIFLISFRIMRVLSYSETINQLGNVLRHVSWDLCGCFILFLIVYLAFLGFGYLIFGRQLETYKTLFVASTTLTNAIIGKNSMNDLFTVDPFLGRIYYFFFVLVLLWILMTMLNATLNVGITTVRLEQATSSPYYGISNLLVNFLKNTVGFAMISKYSFNTSQYERVKQLQNIKLRAQAKHNLRRYLLEC